MKLETNKLRWGLFSITALLVCLMIGLMTGTKAYAREEEPDEPMLVVQTQTDDEEETEDVETEEFEGVPVKELYATTAVYIRAEANKESDIMGLLDTDEMILVDADSLEDEWVKVYVPMEDIEEAEEEGTEAETEDVEAEEAESDTVKLEDAKEDVKTDDKAKDTETEQADEKSLTTESENEEVEEEGEIEEMEEELLEIDPEKYHQYFVFGYYLEEREEEGEEGKEEVLEESKDEPVSETSEPDPAPAPEPEPEPQPQPDIPSYYRSVAGQWLPNTYQDALYNACATYGIQNLYNVIIGQMFQESHFNPYIVSPTQDYGLMQLNIAYHGYIKSLAGHPEWDLVNDPYANIYAGVSLMSNYYYIFGGNVELALTAYNMGPDYAMACGVNPNYVNLVMQWAATY